MSRLDDLQSRVAAMSDDEILTALGPDADSYQEDALDVYRHEAERRGLRLYPDDAQDEPEDAGEGEPDESDGEAGELSSAADRGVKRHPAADEFSAGDRDVECFHCGAKHFLEIQVALPTMVESTVRWLPASVLRCPNCGLLMWFGEPAP
jgi:hypothetical protein